MTTAVVPPLVAFHQPGILQHGQVLRHGRLGHGEAGRDLTRAQLRVGEIGQEFRLPPFAALAFQPAISSPMLVTILLTGFPAIAALALRSVRRGRVALGQARAAMTVVPGPQLFAALAPAVLNRRSRRRRRKDAAAGLWQ